MVKQAAGWKVIDDALPLLTCRYSFGGGDATALAVAGGDGLIVVSPPSSPSEATFTELEAHGKIRAIVAPNAYHTMGVAPWKARFPDADVFAPAQSIARVEKQSKVAGIKPLAHAAEIAGANVDLLDMPHYRTGEALVRARSGSDVIWYVTDVIFNFSVVPPGVAGLLFKWTGSAPGLRLNALSALLMMKDKKAVRRWLCEQAENAPPTILVPSHGRVVRMSSPGKELLEILRP